MRIAIVEDERRDMEQLQGTLEAYWEARGQGLQLRCFESAEDFLAAGWGVAYDLYFLDIRMEGMSGIALAGRIREWDERGAIVFVTNTPDYSLAGYSVDATDYILKPVNAGSMERLMGRVLRRLGLRSGKRIAVRNAQGQFIIHTADIEYVELSGRRIAIHLHGGERVAYTGALQALEAQLPREGGFFRCHSSFIVNLKAVDCLKGSDIRMECGASIPLSRHRRRAFIDALSAYLEVSL